MASPENNRCKAKVKPFVFERDATVIVLNMDRDIERWKKINQSLDKAHIGNVRRVAAYDGHNGDMLRNIAADFGYRSSRDLETAIIADYSGLTARSRKFVGLAFSTIKALREWGGKTEWLLLLEDDFEVDPETLKATLVLKATKTRAEMLWLDYRSLGNTAVGVGLHFTKGAPLCCTEGLLIHRSIRTVVADALTPNSGVVQEYKQSWGFKAGYLANAPHTDFILSFLCYTHVCCSWSPISTHKLHSFKGRL